MDLRHRLVGPGPGAYCLPSTIGHFNFNSRQPTYPKYSFGHRPSFYNIKYEEQARKRTAKTAKHFRKNFEATGPKSTTANSWRFFPAPEKKRKRLRAKVQWPFPASAGPKEQPLLYMCKSLDAQKRSALRLPRKGGISPRGSYRGKLAIHAPYEGPTLGHKLSNKKTKMNLAQPYFDTTPTTVLNVTTVKPVWEMPKTKKKKFRVPKRDTTTKNIQEGVPEPVDRKYINLSPSDSTVTIIPCTGSRSIGGHEMEVVTLKMDEGKYCSLLSRSPHAREILEFYY